MDVIGNFTAPHETLGGNITFSFSASCHKVAENTNPALYALKRALTIFAMSETTQPNQFVVVPKNDNGNCQAPEIPGSFVVQEAAKGDEPGNQVCFAMAEETFIETFKQFQENFEKSCEEIQAPCVTNNATSIPSLAVSTKTIGLQLKAVPQGSGGSVTVTAATACEKHDISAENRFSSAMKYMIFGEKELPLSAHQNKQELRR